MKHIIAFFQSFFFFFLLLFRRIHYSVVFYSPNHFNRGVIGENLYFKHLIKICESNNISFIVFEEPDFNSKQKRFFKYTPFDFVFFFILLFRKVSRSRISYIEKDQKIGKFFKKTILSRFSFDNYITLSQSGLSFFRGLNSSANLFDLQHGIVFSKKESYLKNFSVSENILLNQVKVLLSGEKFISILRSNDKSRYYQKNAICIGSPLVKNKKEIILNKNVLITLQFTSDHTKDENKIMSSEIENLISNSKEFKFYLRTHPRSTSRDFPHRLLKYQNVFISKKTLENDLLSCSLHASIYSTTIFESALLGIPTCLISSSDSRFDIFNTEYHYPLSYKSLSFIFDNYKSCSHKVKFWAERYYQDFNDKKFISLLNE